MKPSDRKYNLYVEDMITSIKRIEEYIGNKEFKEFKKSPMMVDAVIRNFEIIGEAARNISSEIRKKYPEVPWKKMVGLRNLITHEYFGIDYEMIWEIVKTSLPQNKKDLESIFKEIK